jgi:hypothetical protein
MTMANLSTTAPVAMLLLSVVGLFLIAAAAVHAGHHVLLRAQGKLGPSTSFDVALQTRPAEPQQFEPSKSRAP